MYIYIAATVLSIVSLIIINRLIGSLKTLIITKARKEVFDRYLIINSIFEEAKNIAYQKILREELLTWFASKVKTDNTTLDKYEKMYIEYVFSYCGEGIIRDLISIHGDSVSLVLLISNDFVLRVIYDESKFPEELTE